MRIVALFLWLPFSAVVLSCSSSSESSLSDDGGPTVIGDWGGTQASLTMTRSGGDLSYACGAGTIDSTWTLSADGHFTGAGQHFFGGGPLPIQGRPPHPATYVGVVDGDTFSLTVIAVSSLALLRGGPPVSEICL
jgi:hypothetical protein